MSWPPILVAFVRWLWDETEGPFLSRFPFRDGARAWGQLGDPMGERTPYFESHGFGQGPPT